MVSFSCEACGDVLTKKKLDSHRNQCRGASFTCLDCMVHFVGTDYRSHTSCISEAQKYQGHLYREKDKKANKGEKRKSLHFQDDEMVPKKAYFEDVPDEGENAVAIIDVPPRAPTPPAVEALQESVNVFDYLEDGQARSNGNGHIQFSSKRAKAIEEAEPTQHSQRTSSKAQRLSQGIEYGNAPIQPTFERFDSWSQFPSQNERPRPTQPTELRPAYITQIVTPGPDRERSSRHTDKSDKKRKRGYVDDLDLSTVKRPISQDEPMTDASTSRTLHTGLTGGLTRLVTDDSFYEDRIDAGPTPVSPIKRSKREKEYHEATRRVPSYGSTRTATSTKHNGDDDHHRSKRREQEHHDDHYRTSRRRRSPSSSSEEHRPSTRRLSKVKAIDFKPHGSRTSSVQPTAHNQLVTYSSRAELFMSFITKGPDSERGCSINKALKRYHREQPRGDEKDDDDKELWKSLRLRRNDRGEIVLFIA